jgi:DNA-binding transcriptional regulator YbjK
MSSDDYILNADKIFLEEIKIHNDLIETSSELQAIFSRITLSGFSVSDSISLFIDYIQKKEFDKAKKVLQDAVYSLSNLADAVVSAVDKLNSGVLNNGEKTNRSKID